MTKVHGSLEGDTKDQIAGPVWLIATDILKQWSSCSVISLTRPYIYVFAVVRHFLHEPKLAERRSKILTPFRAKCE